MPDLTPEQTRLFRDHIVQLRTRYDERMQELELDAVLISSGDQRLQFRDDLSYPFKCNAPFKHWVPGAQQPRNYVLVERDAPKPKLFFYQPADYWHDVHQPPAGGWADEFELVVYAEQKQLISQLNSLNQKHPEQIAYIGDSADLPIALPDTSINPRALVNYIEFHRARKSAYEQDCIRVANLQAVAGHQAARRAFLNGESEYEISLAYLRATRHNETDLPYDSIIAVNQHSAVLHHTGLSKQRFSEEQRLSFLIDAGANFNGYASDITRTHAYQADCRFAELIEAMDHSQQQVLQHIVPGKNYLELHLEAHRRIGAILAEFNLVNVSAEQCVENGITNYFFPHGLGHLLGLQVHDAGGFMQSPGGEHLAAPDQHPALRLTRTIEADQVFTIEPGLYFIPLLLDKLRSTAQGTTVNWKEVEHLTPFGGIRIEDNILVTDDGFVNLTRQAFAETQTTANVA